MLKKFNLNYLLVLQWFQSAISEIKDILPTFLFTQLIGGAEELLAIHRPFLQDLETRFASWESRGFPDTDQRVDDLMLRHMISIGVSYDQLISS